MALVRLLPAFKDYLWGGHRLVEEYGKESVAIKEKSIEK